MQACCVTFPVSQLWRAFDHSGRWERFGRSPMPLLANPAFGRCRFCPGFRSDNRHLTEVCGGSHAYGRVRRDVPPNRYAHEQPRVPTKRAYLLNFERELSPQGSCRIVQCQSAERSLEHRQRDVYETHKHRAYAVAFYMTGSEIEADEVTQEAFLRAFNQVDEPDAHCVDCAMVNELRERMPLDEQAEPAMAVSGQMLSGRNVKRTEMEEALKELPPNERVVFLLRDVEGYDAERVAGLLDLPRQQVERTLLSARIRMRSVLAAMERQAAAA